MRFEKFRGIEENDPVLEFLILEFGVFRDAQAPLKSLAIVIIAERFRGPVHHEY